MLCSASSVRRDMSSNVPVWRSASITDGVGRCVSGQRRATRPHGLTRQIERQVPERRRVRRARAERDAREVLVMTRTEDPQARAAVVPTFSSAPAPPSPFCDDSDRGSTRASCRHHHVRISARAPPSPFRPPLAAKAGRQDTHYRPASMPLYAHAPAPPEYAYPACGAMSARRRGSGGVYVPMGGGRSSACTAARLAESSAVRVRAGSGKDDEISRGRDQGETGRDKMGGDVRSALYHDPAWVARRVPDMVRVCGGLGAEGWIR